MKREWVWGIAGGVVLAGAVAALAPFVWFYLNQPQMFHDPKLDSLAPVLPDDLDSPALLVFSKTNGFRHKEGIPAALKSLEEIASRAGWSIYFTENGAVHNVEQLARFDVLIWSQTSGRVLTETQQKAMRAFIESGGGFVGIHAAGDDSHSHWDWYQNAILRANFTGHTMIPHLQQATMITVAPDHPVADGLPAAWTHYDEWYAFESSPSGRGSTVLAVVDESSYAPGDYSMPEEHAMIWAHPVGEGRVVYSALGHTARSFETSEYRRLLEQAIRWSGRLP